MLQAAESECRIPLRERVQRSIIQIDGVINNRLGISGNMGGLMTIGVVVEPAQLKNYINRVSSFKPIDNARVIVRRFRTNICLCMAPSGVVGTERLINHTVTDNCAWRLRVSRYGVGLEHLVYLEDPEIVPDSSGHGRPEYQVATLSASLTGNGQLSSGWMHRLWQPEATWSVYNDDISKILEKLANRSTNNMQVTTEIPTVVHVQTTESITADQPTANTSDDHTPIEVGGKKVLWFQAPAQYIIAVQRNLQKNHCIALMYNLSSTVQREMLASLKIINNFRAVYRQVEAALNTSNSSSMPFNEFPVPSSPSLATLFDQWLLWTDQRWVSKIKRMAEKSNTANPTFPPSCALSYSRSHGEPSSTQDPYVSAMLKKHEMTKIYYNLFLRVQHLAHWSSAERRNWFSHPRLPMLLRYLGLSAPSAVQLRQAIYVLRRYLPVYEPRPTDSQASANNYGVAGTFSIETLNQILQNRQQRGVLLNRAMALKFEELRAWPRPASRTSHKVLEHTPVSANSLRMEIRQMDSKDYCYTYLVSLWFRYVRGNLPITCVN
ncbi:hypothetical protein D915_001972 [Fasciola hepatica]|uniref:Uncharacterized protein n=1 Tax=Fasciola hepatica TaxID=6192 RepID=A0A4E0REN6_FASHE|nr:hypothetical protein D915_001972 [Fasciola hepatica]